MTGKPKFRSPLFVLGAVIQGVVLGLLLAIVVVELWSTRAGVQLFEYQKF